MKKTNFLFWTTTIILFLFEGVVPALASQTELAKEGMRHLSYPAYFGNMVVVFKILGALALIIPQVPKRLKEWAYAGFTFTFIGAAVSHAAVDGVDIQTFFPLIFLGLLFVSYFTFHQRIKQATKQAPSTFHTYPAVA